MAYMDSSLSDDTWDQVQFHDSRVAENGDIDWMDLDEALDFIFNTPYFKDYLKSK